MRKPSGAEIQQLGAQYGVDIDDADVDRVEELVASMLEGLDAVDELSATEAPEGVEERTWRDPDENPHNELTAVCDVPPTADADGDSLLDGVRLGLKDNIAVAGVPLTGGSEMLRSAVPGRDAAVVERIRESGGRIVAKTNLDEFAGGARGVSHRGRITNPYDAERIAGGSSGGSAVAVATGRVDAALGTDTGGSCRMPAAMCGVVGMKPTYGLVPLSGVIENTYTLDHVGPITSNVADAARVLEAIAGKDPRDPASLAAAGRDEYRTGGYVDAVEEPPAPKELRIGVLAEGFRGGVSRAVTERTRAAVDALEDRGASVTDVSMPHFEHVAAVKNVISYTELATHWRAGPAPHRRGGEVDESLQAAFVRARESSSERVNPYYRSRLVAGAQLVEENSSALYTRAQYARELLEEEFGRAAAEVDVVVTPTIPDVAPRLKEATNPEPSPTRNTRLANVTRAPAITIPNGSVEGLPVGLQLMADAFSDDSLLGAAAAFEAAME